MLGSVSSGIQGSLAPLSILVNLRLMAGAGAAAIQRAPPVPGAAAPLLPAYGPTAGVGAGVELAPGESTSRWEHLFNLGVGPAPASTRSDCASGAPSSGG